MLAKLRQLCLALAERLCRTSAVGAMKRRSRKAKRKRGGQQGHGGAHREMLPLEKVSKFVDQYPPECENCWKSLPQVPDPSPKRHQQTEIPPVEPYTTEWRRHAVIRALCGYKTRAGPTTKTRSPHRRSVRD